MANIILNSEKQKAIPLMSGQDTVTILIQYATGSPSHGNQTKEERKKRNPNGKRSKTVTVCR